MYHYEVKIILHPSLIKPGSLGLEARRLKKYKVEVEVGPVMDGISGIKMEYDSYHL
jgi:hypothetical protein